MKKALLVLSDGRCFEGKACGFGGQSVGEVVFNTSMTGYQEILTDPSYAGQIVNFTSSHIGNYGICAADSQSDGAAVAGIVMQDLSAETSHFRSEISLNSWLIEQGVVGIYGVDTRELTRHIRDRGAMMGIISHDLSQEAAVEILEDSPKYGDSGLETRSSAADWVEEVEGRIVFSDLRERQKTRIVVLDFGVKYNILESLLSRDLEVVVIPGMSADVDTIRALDADGILFSNGPGDPMKMAAIFPRLAKVCEQFPCFGICLGHQLICAAFGAKIYKLPFGHRGPNHPVQDLGNNRVMMTSQNHGYAVSEDHFPAVLAVTQINLNDRSIEAFEHLAFPVFGVQYHPEAGPGPHDADGVFDAFVSILG